MNFPVLKGASYALIHARDMILHQGSAQTSERHLNPNSEYLQNLPKHLRTFEDVVAYPPNQVYIGSMLPKELDGIPRPWHKNPISGAKREGKYGEIIPLGEFYKLMKAADSFNLVLLNEEKEEIAELVNSKQAEPMYLDGELVGCVKKAHAFDQALSEHVMFENLVSKASATFCLDLLFKKTDLLPSQVDYVIECSEEACGDMNQRGGGNFAKAIAEAAGCVNATGSDVRGFCAAPVHAILMAASLVQAGIYKNVVVVAGGSSAKLGMNAKDHIKKDIPVLEDVLGAFAVHIGENDGKSPMIRTDIVGRHSVGTGSSPQAVTQSIVAEPLERVGLKLADVDAFSVEMQNPDITEPAGAGDVPKANYKMIAALGVMRKEFERSQLNEVVERISMPGFAPTQGHIPSGVPFLGHAKDLIEAGKLNRVMIVGKGSLFLGRLTNQFDGVSFLLEGNKELSAKTRVGITLMGSEHGEAEILKGISLVNDPEIEVVTIESHKIMEELLRNGEIDAAVTMNYSFPIGVSTVGRVITPAFGRRMYIANTTGTSDTDRVNALIKNTIQAIAVAKACGNSRPSVGILNIDGARTAERALKGLRDAGYDINFGESARQDGGIVMRGNDLLQGVPDIMVMDSMTGNVMMKTMSAFSSGGSYEAVGDGYGPGVGEGYRQIVHIVSRTSGAPVIAGSIAFAAACAQGKLADKVQAEFAAAKKAGFGEAEKPEDDIKPPPEKVVTEEIPGIDILALDDAVRVLWKANIFATSGMGCTGPIILVAPEDYQTAKATLIEKEFCYE